jgi:hypothetical protein
MTDIRSNDMSRIQTVILAIFVSLTFSACVQDGPSGGQASDLGPDAAEASDSGGEVGEMVGPADEAGAAETPVAPGGDTDQPAEEIDPDACMMPPFPPTLGERAICMSGGVLEVLDGAKVRNDDPNFASTILVPEGQDLSFRVEGQGACGFQLVSEDFANRASQDGIFVESVELSEGTVSETITIEAATIADLAQEEFAVALWDACQGPAQFFSGVSFEIVSP